MVNTTLQRRYVPAQALYSYPDQAALFTKGRLTPSPAVARLLARPGRLAAAILTRGQARVLGQDFFAGTAPVRLLGIFPARNVITTTGFRLAQRDQV